MHLLTTVAWYSTWSSTVWGLHSHTNAARRPQFTMQTALQHHLVIICTEDVTAARRTLQRLHTDIFSGHDRVGLAQPHECSSKAAIYHANSFATSSSNNLYRGRDCCTTHASKATYRYFLGTRPRLPRRVTLERMPTDWYFLFSACGVDMLLPRQSRLRHSHPVGIEILF